MDANFQNNYILTGRVIKGVLTAFALQAVPIAIYTGITSIDIFHPLLWFYHIISSLVSIRSWLVLVPSVLVMFIIGHGQLECMKSVSRIPESRFQLVRNILTLNNVIKTATFLLLCILLPWAYIIISGETLYRQCSKHTDLRCLNNNAVYVTFSGVWSGIYFVFRRELLLKQPNFPVVEQEKFLQIRFRAISILKLSPKEAFLPLLYSMPLFFVANSFITKFFSKLYSSRLEPDSDIILDQFQVGVLLQAWLLSSLVYFSIRTLRMCLQVHLTEHHQFSLQELLVCIRLNENSFIKRLAFYDLFLLSTGRSGYLSEVYALSQPGGIPHTWNTILRECEQVIREFQSEIEFLSGLKVRPNVKEEISEDVQQIAYPIRMRRLVERDPISPVKTMTLQKNPEEPLKKLFAVANELPLIRFLFSRVPELKLAALLEESQQVIWAIESVTELASRALSEDKFGVVVNDVPIVMSMIVSLRVTMEKIKLGVQRKQKQRDRAARMRSAILCGVRRGLCKMGVTYAEYLDHLNLSPEILHTMKGYAALKL